MSERWHIKKNGNPEICNEEPGSCSLSPENEHFPSKEEAELHRHEIMRKRHPKLFLNLKRSIAKINLLDKPLFMSKFQDDKGEIHKWSIDVEEASDSHFEISHEEMIKFGDNLRKNGKLFGQELKNVLLSNSGSTASSVAKFLDNYNVKYKKHSYF